MWLNRRAIRLHITLVIVFPACLLLGWWQLNVALSGNSLGWVYTFEWPMFAIYAVYMWWRLLHDDREEDEGDELPTSASTATASTEREPELLQLSITEGDEQHPMDNELLYASSPYSVPVISGTGLNSSYEDIYEEIYGDDELAAYNQYLAELSK